VAHVLELRRQGLEIKDEVDNSQLPVFTHEHFKPQQLVEAREVDEVVVGSYVSFICKNIQEAKTRLG